MVTYCSKYTISLSWNINLRTLIAYILDMYIEGSRITTHSESNKYLLYSYDLIIVPERRFALPLDLFKVVQ